MLGLAALCVWLAAPTKTLRLAVRELTGYYADLVAAGPLIDALGIEDRETGAAVRSALAELLPRLRPADVQLLSHRHLLSLHRVLNRNVRTGRHKDADFVIAVIRAVEKIGGDQSLLHLERLAHSGGRSPDQVRIREAAHAALPRLRDRLDPKSSKNLLLRPSLFPGTAAELLLRPACASATSDAGSLLRAGQQTETERDA
jgi:hypothetical protein